MALGKRKSLGQKSLFISYDEMPTVPADPFYTKVNAVLAEKDFDAKLEALAKPYYHNKLGRPGLHPGVYVRMLLVGYFEAISSERQLAWRCADSLSIRCFLGYRLNEITPDHTTLSATRKRLPLEFFDEVFQLVLEILHDFGLINGNIIGVDASTMDANAAMKSLLHKVTGQDYNAWLKQYAEDNNIDAKTPEELHRMDRKRKGKKRSNEDWESSYDPDSRIGKTKDGRYRMIYKNEHSVDLETSAIIEAFIYYGNLGDTTTGPETYSRAGERLLRLSEYDNDYSPYEWWFVADKGYCSDKVLTDLLDAECKACIAEPDRVRRRWTDKNGVKSPEKAFAQQALYDNRRRIKSNKGVKARKLRCEVVERTFAHVMDTGGMRRTWLKGLDNVQKRYFIQTAGHNLGLVMRKLMGAGKPRAFAACFCFIFLLLLRKCSKQRFRPSDLGVSDAIGRINVFFRMAA